MGLAVEMGFRVRKFVVVSVRTCYRSVRNYPFLFGLLCFLILLYRSCPFLFSLLVSASPVLICTAVLLGTLLSFGQPNIPEIETEEKVSRDVASLRSEFLDNATVVAKEDDSFTVERFDGNKVGNSCVESGSEEDRKTSKLDEHADFVDFVPGIHGHDREIQFERGGVEEFEKGTVEHADFVDFVPGIHEHDREIQFERGGVEEFEKGKVEEFEKGKVEEFEKGRVEEFVKGRVEEFEEGKVEEFEKGKAEEFEKGEVEKAATAERELHSSELEERGEIFERDFDIKSLATDGENAVENQLLAAHSMRNKILEVEDCNISIEPVHKGDHLNLSLDDKDDRDENDYDSSGSESDRAESSSPDASMADIIPLLDELHPLLDSETPLPAHRSNEESDASSEQSHKSDGECVMSDDEAENQGEEGGVVEQDDDDDDDDDDEGMHEEKEDESKSAIKWTEDDQKNLMDLGSLELERNQRLENLIARRRARNNLRMLAGKNLIDLDGFDLPVNVPPISTARRNPFDLPYDSCNNMGLPPIPGSAPSILLPRRNPFDLPYDPNEEKPDLKSDDFVQEFLAPQHKDIFRRHESFSVGPSNFAVPKLEQQNIRWKPYFMPEKIAAEGTSYSSLERQFSEVSESKLSSVSDTESMSSIADQDDKKPDESQSFLETTAVSYLDPTASSIEHGNGSWEDIGSEDYVQENRDVHHEVIEITLGSTESHFESQSGSSEIGAADTPVEINASEIHSKSVLVETDFSSNSSLSSLSEVNETPFEIKTDEVRLSSPRVEGSGIETTSTSLPAALEEDADFKIASEVLDDNQHKEPVYDSSPSAEGKDSDVHSEIEQDVTSSLKDMPDASSELHVVDKNEQESREVSEVIVHEVTKVESPKHGTNYDAHNLSVATELLVEHVSIDAGLSFSDIASIEKGIVDDIKEDKDQLTSHEEDIINGIHKIEDGNLDSSPSSDQISSRSLTFTETGDQLSSAVNHVSADIGSPSHAKHVEMHETLNNEENVELEQTKIYRSSSSDSSCVEEVILQNDVICHTDIPNTSISNRGSEIPVQDLNDLVGMTDSEATSYDHLSTTNATIPESQEQKNPAAVEEQVILISSSSTFPSELEQVGERSMNEKEVVRSEQDFVQPSSVKSHTESEALQDLDIKIASSGSSTPNVTPEVISSVTELEQSWSDKPMVEPVISHRHDAEEPGILSTDSAAEVNSENIAPKVHEDISTVLSSVESDSSLSSSDHDFRTPYAGRDPKYGNVDQVVFEDREEVSKHLDYLAEAYGSHFSETMIREEVDEIADIDEGLLLELDEVGDFSIKEVGEPVLEKKVMPEEAQAERFEFGSNSNLTEAKSVIPILEARSLDDINLAFRQLHEGVDMEDVILPSAIESQVKEEAKPKTSSDLEVVEARSLGDIHVALTQALENNVGESGSSSKSTETKLDIPILEARSLDDINLAFRQLHEGVVVEDVILPSAIESQVKEEAKPETSSDVEIVEARSLGDIHVALMQVSENNIGESGSSSKPTETKSDIPVLEAKSLDDINLAFGQLHEGVDVEDVILPSAVESQVREEAKPKTMLDLEVVEARTLEDIHVALMQPSENNKGESGSTSNPTETKSDIPVLEARSLDDINLAFRQLHEGVDVEDVILPSVVKNQANEEAKAETSSDLEVVEEKSLGDIHVALMQVSEKNLSELPTISVSNDPSKEELEPAGVDSIIAIAPSNTTTDADKPADIMDEKSVDPNVSASKTKDDADKPADITDENSVDPNVSASKIKDDAGKSADVIDEKSVDPNVSATKTKDKKAKSGRSESGSSSSSSSSDSD